MTDLTDVLGGRFPLPRETPEEDSSLLRDRKGRIRTKDPARDRTLKLFLAAFLVIGIAAMLLMKIDWLQFCEGLVRIPEALGKLIQIDFSQIDITFSSLLESDVYKRQVPTGINAPERMLYKAMRKTMRSNCSVQPVSGGALY